MVLKRILLVVCLIPVALVPAQNQSRNGRFLFEQETFGGNGRTCLTCHSRETGTVSPLDAQRRFALQRTDPLFLHDGSDDGSGRGFQRMLTEATVLVTLPLPPNVRLADDPGARVVTVRRGIPSTLNTPALDPVLMTDGREPSLVSQARSAIRDHAQVSQAISDLDLEMIANFQRSDAFFSSAAVREFARGGPPPTLPPGTTDAEKRGRTFFEERFDPNNLKVGSCAVCHSGPMLDRTVGFFPGGAGLRFISVGVSEFNDAKNPVRTFVFRDANGVEKTIQSPDPGRALVTGRIEDVNAFKISPLRGIRRTAPYFHDNSARTLEDVARHYAKEFARISPGFVLTPQDQADIVAYMKLLD